MRVGLLKNKLVALLGMLLLGTSLPLHAADFAFERKDDRIVVRAGDALVTEYRFKERRPCLSPVFGPDGRHMTRRWPLVNDPAHPESKDHPHHSGLWFAHGDVRLEGNPSKADFWHKDRIVHQGFVDYEGNASKDTLVAENQWIRKDGQVLATDRTRIQFGQSEAGRWIDYTVHISAPTDQALILGDTKEGTMALRVIEELAMETNDKTLRHLSTGKITNSEGVTGKEAWGKRAKWCAYYGDVIGKPALIAIFDHPENPRHPTWWMARHYGLFGANAFGKSFFEKAPRGSGDFRIPAGETMTFRYRFLFESAAFEASAVEAQYMRFAEEEVSNDEELNWTSIFNGQDFEGWEVPKDNIWWSVKDGVCTVQSGPKQKGSILWTRETYTDFTLELDFRMGREGVVDTGVFLRDEREQIQIGISGSKKRDMTGSPYISGRGYPVEAEGVADLLKVQDWNTMRIQVVGSNYTVWLNGKQVMTYSSDTVGSSRGPLDCNFMPWAEHACRFPQLSVE